MNRSLALVIADSHGNTAVLTAILAWVKKNAIHCDAAIFLGDGLDDLAPASARAGHTLPWYSVRGNGDYHFSVPDNMTLDICGRTLFLSHGNRYGVREGTKTIAAIARNAGAEAALFGHTHIPCFMEAQGVVLMNPGSISRPRSKWGCTFAILECPDSGPLAARFFTITPRSGTYAIQEGAVQ